MKLVRSTILLAFVSIIFAASFANHAVNAASGQVDLGGTKGDWLKVVPDSSPSFALSIPSNTDTEYFSNFVYYPAVEAWKHPTWPSLTGATWIWKSFLVTPAEALNGSSVIVFQRTFDLPEQVETAIGTLHITADNAYETRLNGVLIGDDGVLDVNSCDPGYKTVESYPVVLLPGENTLSIHAINYKDCNGNNAPQSNPAGVLFRLDVTYTLSETFLYIPLTLR